MYEIQELYREDLVLKSQAQTKEEVLEEVGNYLYERNLVKDSFVSAIIEREQEFPTGIDLKPVGDGLPNVALPHTDTEHCKAKVVVFVKLENSLSFNNMIQPDDELQVDYLFVIVNDQKTNQTNVLSELMDFMTKEENMHQLDELESTTEIYEFLTKNKKGRE